MNANDLNNLMNNAPVNIHGYDNKVLVYDMNEKKYFFINASESHELFQERAGPPEKVVDTFSTNSHSNYVNPSIEKGFSFSDNISKKDEIGNNIKKRVVKRKSTSNSVAKSHQENKREKRVKVKQKNNNSTPIKLSLCDSAKDNTLKKDSNSNKILCTVVKHTLPPKYMTQTPKKTYVCDVCQSVFDNNYLCTIHKCTPQGNNNPNPKSLPSSTGTKNVTLVEVISLDNKLSDEAESGLSPKNIVTQTPKKTYVCDVCQNVFDNNYLRTIHKCTARVNNNSAPKSLSPCNGTKSVTLEEVLSLDNKLSEEAESALSPQNIVTQTPKKTYVCDVCQNVFDNSYLCAIHKCTAQVNNSISKNLSLGNAAKNGTLEEVLSSLNKLSEAAESVLPPKNIVTQTQKKTYVCDFCQDVFDSNYLCSIHRCPGKVNNNSAPKNRSVCDAVENGTLEEVSSSNKKINKPKKALSKKKIKTQKPKKTYVCFDCQNTFDNNYLRALHKCSALKCFDCQTCSSSFPNSYSLYRHKQSNICKTSYMNEKPVKDTSTEELSSNNKSDAAGESDKSNNDTTTSTPAQVSVCNVCYQAFKKIFLHKCIASKTFECEFCKMSFRNSYVLSRHKQVHAKEKSNKDCGSKEEVGSDNKSGQVAPIVVTLERVQTNENSCEESRSNEELNSGNRVQTNENSREESRSNEELNPDNRVPTDENSLEESRSNEELNSNRVQINENLREESRSNEELNSDNRVQTNENSREESRSNEELNSDNRVQTNKNSCEESRSNEELNSDNRVQTNENLSEESKSNEVSNLDNNLSADKQTSLSSESPMTSSQYYKTFFCNFCKKIFYKWYLFTLHSCSKFYECEYCNKKYPSYMKLKSHQQVHVDKKRYKCNLCEKKFFYNSNLIKHSRVHTVEKPFGCDICSKRFTEKYNLKRHIHDIHINKKQCTFKRKSKLKKKHICNFCHKVCAKRKDLLNHFLTHTGEKPYECDTCEKKFANRGSLTRHLRVHTGEKPFVCHICDSRFCQKCSLTTHMKDVHMGSDAYVCNICNESFPKKNAFMVHRRLHKGEKPHVCNLCGEGFSRERDMRQHQLLHYEENII